VYVSCVVVLVKVEAENSKEKACPILATGGSCELIGNDTVGVATVYLERYSRSHGSIKDAMIWPGTRRWCSHDGRPKNMRMARKDEGGKAVQSRQKGNMGIVHVLR
jgi:hypothetical protein